jgi:hypothetical protein
MMHRSTLLLLGLFAVVAVFFAHTAHADKIGSRLGHFLAHGDENGVLPKHSSFRRSDGTSEETTAIWVLFTSKCGSVASPRELSAAALARRAKHGQGVSELDRPVCNAHKTAVEEALKELSHPVSLRRESAWLNGASYTVAVSELERAVRILEALPFVAELEVVGRLIQAQQAELQDSEAESADSRLPRDVTHTHELEHLRHLQERPLERRNVGLRKNAALQPPLKREVDTSTAGFDYGDSFDQLQRISIPELHRRGLNGSGVIISVLDTGFNYNHESLRNLTVIGKYDFVYNDTNVLDESGESGASNHGTAAWSNIGGLKPGQLYGGSFGASFILCKTEDTRSETATEEDNFVRAIEFSEGLGADILSASLGYNGWLTWSQLDGKQSIIARAGQRAIDLGLLFVVANGNSGQQGIGTPADMDRVLALGALAKNNGLASFSSLGPTSDGRIKPEVSAPGVSVKVASHTHVNGYKYLSGTSFATPLTAGVAGLVLQANPTWTNIQLRNAIIYSANPVGNSPNIMYGWGIVNATAAAAYQSLMPSESNCVQPYGTWNAASASCQCNEGYYNFDCREPKLNCKDWCPGLCNPDGSCLCTASGMGRCTRNATTMSVAWNCNKDFYNDGNTCHCQCGLYDPDCADSFLPVQGCTTNNSTTCFLQNSRGVCELTPSAEPPTQPSTQPPTTSSEPSAAPTAPTNPSEKRHGILASILLAILSLFLR